MTDLPIIRVFPRRTVATPTDAYVFTGPPPMHIPPHSKVMVSVTFTWDLDRARRLFELWKPKTSHIEIGGPAMEMRGENFTPGMFLKKGYVITSRGCRNRCPHCSVWKRDGKLRELPITEGYIVQDDNLLSCSRPHIESVFDMVLNTQGKFKAKFTGGLEAKLLKDWHVDLLMKVRPKQVYMAYDTPDDLEPLIRASKVLNQTALSKSDTLRCYVLIGYKNDTLEKAEQRMKTVVGLKLIPFAMFWRDEFGRVDPKWIPFQRRWMIPFMVRNKLPETQIKPKFI